MELHLYELQANTSKKRSPVEGVPSFLLAFSYIVLPVTLFLTIKYNFGVNIEIKIEMSAVDLIFSAQLPITR